MSPYAEQASKLFAWSARFATGMADLDREHEQLMALINRLAHGALDGADAATLCSLLDALQHEAASHFAREEALMGRHGLGAAAVAAHQREHASLLEQLRSVRSLADAPAAATALARLLPFFAKWLLFHMLGADMRLAQEIAALERGEAPPAGELAEARQSEALVGMLDALNEIMDSLAQRTIELQQANQRLQVSEARLAAAQRAAGITAWDLEPRTLALSWSGEVERLLGGPLTPGSEAFPALMERMERADRAPVQAAIEAVRRGAREFAVRFRMPGPGGSVRWLEAVGECLREPGHEHLAGVLRDITAEKQTQARLEESNAQLTLSLAALERYAADLTRLNELSAGLQGCRSPAEAFDLVERVIARMALGCGGALGVIEGEALHMMARWGEGVNLPQQVAVARCPALQRGVHHVVGPGSEETLCAHLALPPDRPLLCQPLRALGELLGVLVVGAPAGVGEAEWARIVHLASMVGEALGLALSNVRLREALHEQAIRDPLTGLLNRRYLDETLPRELLRAARERRPLVLAMLDLDHFKRINDGWGHEAGDAVLAQFAALLRRHLRAADLACRFGGEEFVVVLAGATLAEARERFAALAGHVHEEPAQRAGEVLPVVSFSAGLVQAPSAGATAEALLRAADLALYQAKADGRDCVREGFLAEPALAAEVQEGHDDRDHHQRE